jgi:hypothetical protein
MMAHEAPQPDLEKRFNETNVEIALNMMSVNMKL